MSTLRVTGLKQETSTATNISLAVGGGVTVAGISTFYSNAIFTNDVTVSGNISVGGTLTYEDVTSVDSIGIITARSGIDVGTGTSISSPSSNVLTLGTNNEERLRISSNGDVGIGTDNPQYELDVTGNIRNTGHHIFGSSGMCVSSPYTVVSNGGTFDFTVPGTSVCGYVYLISSLISNAAVTTRRSYFFGSRLGNNPVLTPEHTNNGISGSPSFTFAHLNNNVLRYTSSQAGDVTVTIGFLGIMGF